MNVVLAFGPSYLTPARVLLQSLRQSCSGPLQLYLLHSTPDPRPLESICAEFSMQGVAVPSDWLNSLPRLSSHSLEAYLPLCVAQCLPQLDRALFLDADMLCLDDLRPLWNRDLQGNVVGAVTDQAIPTFGSPRGVQSCRQLRLDPDHPYFNAGVLLLDLALWRQRDITAAAHEYLQQHPVHFLHQEALNVILRDSWQPLELRWNVIASLYQRRYSPPVLRSVHNPGLIHFAGHFKPWRIRTHGRLGEIYRERLQGPVVSGWRERILGVYDRYLRDWLYGLEHWLWRNG